MTRIERCMRGLWWLMLLALPALAPAQQLPAALDEATGLAPRATPAQRQARWQAMTPAQRSELRARYRAWRALDETERNRVRAGRARWEALPADQQRALRTQFTTMDRLHRDGWRLGPTLGAHYPRLQPLFGYVPEAQRGSVLTLLRALDQEQLRQLAVLSQRTPPQERDALRDELLAQPAAARAAWLKRRLGG